MPARKLRVDMPNGQSVDFDEETTEKLLSKARAANMSPREYIERLLKDEHDRIFSKN